MPFMTKFYILIAVIVIAGGALLTYNHAIAAKERAEAALALEMTARIKAEGELEAEKIISEAKAKAGSIARESQIENAIDADKRSNKASARKISETSMRDAEKYTAFVKKVDQKNVDLFACKSDLRNAGNDKACIGHIR